jgi:xanthine dehydrogenase accessory factor
MTARVLEWVLHEQRSGHRTVMATVLNTSGSVPGKTGARLALSARSEEWVGTVGGAGLEKTVLQRCRTLLSETVSPAAEVHTYGLNKGAKGYEVTPLDSLCGGRVTVALEVMIPMPHVYIMGGGHCGEAIAACLHSLEWSYSVHDTREDFVSIEKYPVAQARSTVPANEVFSNETLQSLKRFSDIVLLGHDWAEDQERLLGILQIAHGANAALDGVEAPRVGVIGSRSKWQAFESVCRNEGIASSLLDQVVCPIGLNIGAQTPQEIAVAVVAQIMAAHKNADPNDATWRQSS